MPRGIIFGDRDFFPDHLLTETRTEITKLFAEVGGTAHTSLAIAQARTPTASFVVPDEPGKQLHSILEVSEAGAPALVGYQRIIAIIAKSPQSPSFYES